MFDKKTGDLAVASINNFINKLLPAEEASKDSWTAVTVVTVTTVVLIGLVVIVLVVRTIRHCWVVLRTVVARRIVLTAVVANILNLTLDWVNSCCHLRWMNANFFNWVQ